MRKKFIYNIIGLAFIFGAIIGCDESSQEVSPIVEPDDSYPTVTVTTDFTGSTVTEDTDTIYYTFTLNKPINRTLTFSARVIGGEADDHDIEVTPAVVPAWGTEAELMIIFPAEWEAEDDETAEIEFGLFSLADKYQVYPGQTYPTLNVTIKNYESDWIDISFTWDKDITINPNDEYFPDYTFTESAGGEVDLDFWYADATDFDIDDPWATYVDYLAGTGSHPEHFMDVLADGEYVIMCNVWYNAFADTLEYPKTMDITHEFVPVTATFRKAGVFEAVYVQTEESQIIKTDLPGYDNAEYDGEINDYVVCKIKVENGIYSVINYFDEEVVGSGKSIKERTPRDRKSVV